MFSASTMLGPYYRFQSRLRRQGRETQNVRLLISADKHGIKIELERDICLQAGEEIYLSRFDLQKICKTLWPDEPTET